MGKSVRKPVRYRFFRIIITLGILLAGTYFISEWLPFNKKVGWSRELISIPPADITTLVVLQSFDMGEEFSFNRLEDGAWQFIGSNTVHPADKNVVLSLLESVTDLTATGIRFTKDTEWHQFGLADSESVAVKLFVGEEQVAHCHIGLTTFDSLTAKPVTFVRMEGDKNVFMVEGGWGPWFKKPAENFAVETKIDFNHQAVQTITFRYPCDSNIVLRKTANNWVDNIHKINYDNRVIDDFLQNFKTLKSVRKSTGFNETTIEPAFVERLELKLQNEPDPVIFTRYLTALPDNVYLFQCSLKPFSLYQMDYAKAAASFDWKRLASL